MPAPQQNFKRIILLGASTGGTDAIKAVLKPLPANTPPILYVQHILPNYTKGLARSLNEITAMTVKEAENGELLQTGVVYLSPGDRHLELDKQVNGWVVKVYDGPRVNLHIPSVEPLFLSGAKFTQMERYGVMLTGMGKDGSKAMLELKKSGARTIAQNEASCVVYGMPRAAIELGAVDEVLSLEQIGQYLAKLAS